MSFGKEIKILLVDDHQMLRDGLRSLIEQKSHLNIVGEASDGREAIKKCVKLNPDVVVMDVAMSGLNGIESAKQICKSHPSIKIIGLSMHANKQYIQSMFNAGAYGYLLKDGDASELITAIDSVMRNKKYLSKNINQEFLSLLKESDGLDDKNLSSRETEVLQLLAEGKSSKEIGELLFLSSKTVDVHRNNIMKKLDLFTIPELTKYAIREGLTSLEDF
ncbi:DNA-binding response regulator [Polaribacter pacificus]|uniref:DNA-binding response regulator n=1 Tax=Polaribacter pacificus TaxID=1775173 RepID=A0A917MFG0_9FLAO|nr:response regulator transcription factor [Polaribacter pacificus]GGH03706.1 DNA-binding response regulator [Polaribacter pacificus]